MPELTKAFRMPAFANDSVRETDRSDSVEQPSLAFSYLQEEFDLPMHLLGGRKAMIAAGQKYLPKFEGEGISQYNVRLNSSFLFGAYGDTMSKLSGMPFSRPTTYKDTVLPEPLKGIVKNADMTGNSYHQFAKTWFEESMSFGMSHVLVTYPSDTGDNDLNKQKRPYFIRLHPLQVFFWDVGRDALGNLDIREIRYRTVEVVKHGSYGQKAIPQIRVIRKDDWEVWNKTKTGESDSDWVQVGGGQNTLGKVPLVTHYTNKEGDFVASPPLRELAELNLAHWQSYSDQRNILKFARSGMIAATGVEEDELNNKLEWGPSALLHAASPLAQFKILEHTGASVSSGRDDLNDLVDWMVVLGLQPLVRKTGAETATGQIRDELKSDCSLQQWTRSLQEAGLACFQLAAEWAEVELPDDFNPVHHTEFGLSQRAAREIDWLLEARKQKEISRKRFLMEVHRRSTFGEDFEVDEELLELAKDPAPEQDAPNPAVPSPSPQPLTDPRPQD